MKYLKESDIIKYLTFAALVIYFLLGLTSMVSRGMLLIILLVSVICFFKSDKSWNNPGIKGIILLIALNTIYYLLSSKTVLVYWDTSGFFANVFMNLNVFFFSYYFAIKGKMNENEMKCLFVALFIACSIKFFITKEMIFIERNGGMETMNMVYNFVVLMPYLYFFKHRIISVLFLFPIAYFVAYGGKRGAILLFVIAAIIIVYNIYFKSKRGNYLYKIALVVGIFIIGYQIMYKVYEDSILLQWRLEMTMEGNANGRENIYGTIWEFWLNSPNFFRLLFGFGFCSSVEVTGNYAHNDWLELLSMSGLFGICIYIYYFIGFYTEIKHNAIQKPIISLVLLLWLAKSCFSMCMYSVGCMPLTLLSGYLIGINNSVKIVKKRHEININK